MSLVEVLPYDPEWRRSFERIHMLVWPAVCGIAVGVEHVGSTSVPGLPAKPIIDACIVVPSRSDVPVCIDALMNLGYAHRGNLGVPDREAFRAPEVPRGSDAFPRHHLYLSPRGCLSLKNQLGLRDYLRSHPEVAHEYGELKGSLARRFPDDINSYVAGKTDFILRILDAIGFRAEELAEIRRINQIDGSSPGDAATSSRGSIHR